MPGLLALLYSQPATAQSTAPATSQPVIPATVSRVAESGQTALLDVPDSPPLGSRVWCFDGLRPVARGTIILRRGRQVGMSIDWTDAGPRTGQAAIILSRDAAGMASPRTLEPFGVITKVNETGTRVESYLCGGPHAAGDTLQSEHEGWPIARLTVVTAVDSVITADVTPLVANARPAPHDRVFRWPDAAEKRSGRLRSRVLRISEQGPDRELWIPIPSRAAFSPGDRWEIRRGNDYVGHAIATRVTDLFALATTNAALCRTPARAGDHVIRRPAADVISGRTPLYVFRVEGPYALLSGGEADGLRIGMSLLLVRNDRTLATLRINTVNEDNCGVTRVDDVPATSTAPVSTQTAEPVNILPWDTVFVCRPASQQSGRVVRVHAGPRLIEIAYPLASPAVGSVVQTGRPPAMKLAIIVRRENTAALAALLEDRDELAAWLDREIELQVDD